MLYRTTFALLPRLTKFIVALSISGAIVVGLSVGTFVYYLTDTRPLIVETAEPYIYDPYGAWLDKKVTCFKNEQDCDTDGKKWSKIPVPKDTWTGGQLAGVWREYCIVGKNPAIIHRQFIDTVLIRLDPVHAQSDLPPGCYRSGFPVPIPDNLSPRQWIFRVVVEHPKYNPLKRFEYRLKDANLTIVSNPVRDKIKLVEDRVKQLEDKTKKIDDKTKKLAVQQEKKPKWWPF